MSESKQQETNDTPPEKKTVDSKPSLSEQDEEIIRKRLQELGYIE